MAIVRNTTPSQRFIGDYSLPPRKDVEVPDKVIEKYKASGRGRKRLFDDGLLVVKTKEGRVVRMESAETNVAPDPEPTVEAPAEDKKKGKKGKKG